MIAPTSSYYYAEAIEGAKEAARLAGVRLMLAISEYNQVEELRILERMIALDIDGILITPSKSTLVGSKIKEAIEQAPLPVTVLERIWEFPTAGATVDCVRSDHRHGAELAVAHLAELGHRRIAVWTFDNPHEDEIKDGFEEAALRAGCELVHPSFDYGHPDWDSIDLLENARRYLAGLRDGGATAVLVHPDRVALHVVQAAAEAGLRIPEDLSVVAYDDEVAGLAERPLTAIAPPKKAIGFAAIDACLRSIAHGAAPTGPFPAQRIRLLPHLNVRESTSAPAR
jgi:DNA-binding LacI/PurR family transcriptional regulator